MTGGLETVVERYDANGPLVAAFLANMLATFGDKGQLVVVTLASRYDARTVFAGAMGAFTLWSAVEVALGQWIVSVVSDAAMTLATGGLFVLFGVWTLRSAAGQYGGVLTSFVFILFAAFGDKTQALTITLAGTFPDAPLAVFVGVVAALGLRTGVDAVVGEKFERWLSTRWVELVAAAVFLAFGLVVLGLLPESVLLALLAGIVVLAVVWGLRVAL